MIRVLNEPDEKVFSAYAFGDITGKDYDLIIPMMKQKIEDMGRIRWFLELGDEHSFELGAVVKDLKFDWDYGKKIERVAIVGASELEKKATEIFSGLMGGPIRFFKKLEREKAENDRLKDATIAKLVAHFLEKDKNRDMIDQRERQEQ